ncbi:MAG: hypothetical protein Q9187_002236 [Circinaria calcarea]
MLPAIYSQLDEKLKKEYSKRDFPEEKTFRLLQYRIRNSIITKHSAQQLTSSTATMLEPTIRRRILKSLLVTEPIRLPTSGLVNAAILRTNKQLYGEAVRILYGKNRFVFYEPDVLLEWLNMIGDNITKIRDMRLSLTTGYVNGIGPPAERLWLGAFIRLAPLQQLTFLELDFTAWLPSSPALAKVESRTTVEQSLEQIFADRAKEIADQAKKAVIKLLNSFTNQGLSRVAVQNKLCLLMRRKPVPL